MGMWLKYPVWVLCCALCVFFFKLADLSQPFFLFIQELELSVAHLEDKQERDFERHKKAREENEVRYFFFYITKMLF